ncbi:MAG: site-specific integrase [Bacteroidota bacterium]
MKRSTFNILFFVKWKKALKSGDVPVYVRITINGESAEMSLKRSVNPGLWDSCRAKAKGNSQESIELNGYIQSVRNKLYIIQQEFQEKVKRYDSKSIVNAFLGKGSENREWKLIELFKDHNTKMEALVDIDYSPRTLQRFESALNHITAFIGKQYHANDIFLHEVNHKFIVDFDFYLKSEAHCQHNSAMKHVKALKKVIRIALANEYIRKNPFASYQITTKLVERNQLSEQELLTLCEKRIENKRLDRVRDLFVVQCYTGLSYKDLASLKKSDIEIGIDKNKWIIMQRGKTGVKFRVPLFEKVENIFDKYKHEVCCLKDDKLLPVPSNQKMNEYLKEIGVICGIHKELHTHLARHTFATTVLLGNGIPIETVSHILGHTKIQTTQIYARVLDTKLNKDMQGLRNKFSS